MPNQNYSYVKKDKVRTFGGWYQNTVVQRNGKTIGRLQERQRGKRNELLTVHDATSSCVLGIDKEWLVKVEAQRKRDMRNRIRAFNEKSTA